MRVTSSFLAWLIVTEYYVPVSRVRESLCRTLEAINDGYWKRALPTRHSTRDNRKFPTEVFEILLFNDLFNHCKSGRSGKRKFLVSRISCDFTETK
ncbi:hypothetical protein ALC53_04948 [Atta colombica]|uniref:Uncharacterized protein n=1 Tax=Atta colombica TaxID=520822 RepID=A0A195BKM4_9HYME|nr:hypothetical protein ALC53_04948 [Atta colombica]